MDWIQPKKGTAFEKSYDFATGTSMQKYVLGAYTHYHSQLMLSKACISEHFYCLHRCVPLLICGLSCAGGNVES